MGYDIEPVPRRSRYDLDAIDNFTAGRRMGEHLVNVGAQLRRQHFSRSRFRCRNSRMVVLKWSLKTFLR